LERVPVLEVLKRQPKQIVLTALLTDYTGKEISAEYEAI